MGGQELSDQHRLRIGLVVLVTGVILMLWAWGSWAYRLSAEKPDPRIGTRIVEAPTEQQVQAAGAMRWFLVVVFVVAVGGLLGSYVLLRMARRYRESANRSRPPATNYPDAWSMHRLPDDEA